MISAIEDLQEATGPDIKILTMQGKACERLRQN
jgi:hypothetical protein